MWDGRLYFLAVFVLIVFMACFQAGIEFTKSKKIIAFCLVMVSLIIVVMGIIDVLRNQTIKEYKEEIQQSIDESEGLRNNFRAEMKENVKRWETKINSIDIIAPEFYIKYGTKNWRINIDIYDSNSEQIVIQKDRLWNEKN